MLAHFDCAVWRVVASVGFPAIESNGIEDGAADGALGVVLVV